MTNEIFKDEILKDEQLDQVAGGNIGDRTLAAMWVANYYGKGALTRN